MILFVSILMKEANNVNDTIAFKIVENIIENKSINQNQIDYIENTISLNNVVPKFIISEFITQYNLSLVLDLITNTENFNQLILDFTEIEKVKFDFKKNNPDKNLQEEFSNFLNEWTFKFENIEGNLH